MAGYVRCPFCMTEHPETHKYCTSCGHSSYEAYQSMRGDELPPLSMLSDRYILGTKIGRGGFGITYIGFDNLLNMKVAIKEYFPIACSYRREDYTVAPVSGRAGEFKAGLDAFLYEAQMLSIFVDEPNIVTICDFFSQCGTTYIVMEYLEGQTLEDYISVTGKQSFEAALNLMQPIIKALEKVHSNGYVHADLSPSNIMLLKDGTAKLFDFGSVKSLMAKYETSTTDKNDTMLNLEYASPEQFRDNAKPDPRSDIYSFCAILYKLVTGQSPISSVKRIQGEKLIPPRKLKAEITPSQEQVIMNGLALEAQQRPADILTLINSFHAKPARSKKLIAAIAGIAAVLALSAVLLFSGGKKGEVPKDPATPIATQQVKIAKQNEELCADAYPVPIYAGMSELKDFKAQRILENKLAYVDITGCFIGNGSICLVAEFHNNSSEVLEINVYNLLKDDIELTFNSLNHEDTNEVDAGATEIRGLWLNTDLMCLAGLDRFDSFEVEGSIYNSSQTYSYEELAFETGVLKFPEMVELETKLDGKGVITLNEIFGCGDIKIECLGLSLHEDSKSGEILLRCTIAPPLLYGERIFMCSIYCDSVSADGAPVSNPVRSPIPFSFNDNSSTINTLRDAGLSTSADEFQREQDMRTEQYLCLGFDYSSSSYRDSMNVLHTEKSMPKNITIELTAVNTFDSSAPSKSMGQYSFAIDEDGICRFE